MPDEQSEMSRAAAALSRMGWEKMTDPAARSARTAKARANSIRSRSAAAQARRRAASKPSGPHAA